MLETIDQWDRSFFFFLNNLRADWLDTPMYAISDPRFSLLWFLIIFYWIKEKYSWKILLFSLIGLTLVITLNDRISVELFKEVFQRLRPTHNPETKELVHTVLNWKGEIYRGGKFSFVSSHAANYFGMGTYFYLLLKPSKKAFWLIYIWVALVAYSRIYLGVHYPGDILGGAILGISIGFLVKWIFSIVLKRIDSSYAAVE